MQDIAGFCRRVGISLNAGLNLIDAVKREAKRQKDQKLWQGVVASLEDGNSFADSLRPYKARLGEMFVALVEVGEESGRLGEMLSELADYYEQMLQLRRDFQKSLVLPAIELIVAVMIIGILILALGFIEQLTGTRIDILGFGLVGFPGFVKYLIFLAIVGSTGFFLYRMMKQSVKYSRPVHYFLARIPKIGKLFKTLALMKLTWGLHLTMRTGMDVRRALRLSFEGVGFEPIRDQLPVILDEIEYGGSLTDAFLSARGLDGDLISSVDSGEQSGNLPELMQKLTNRYLQEALVDLKIVSVVGGFVVYGFVAFLIILMIFRVFSFYLGVLNNAAAGI